MPVWEVRAGTDDGPFPGIGVIHDVEFEIGVIPAFVVVTGVGVYAGTVCGVNHANRSSGNVVGVVCGIDTLGEVSVAKDVGIATWVVPGVSKHVDGVEIGQVKPFRVAIAALNLDVFQLL
jgi:hypothetical protein